MARRWVPKEKKYRVLAIILIASGMLTLLINQLGGLPDQWTRDSLGHWLLFYGPLLLIIIGTILWLWVTYDSSKGDWMLGHAMRRNIVATGVAFLFLGTVISLGSQLGLINGSWTTIASIIFNMFWLFIGLVSVLPPTATSEGRSDSLQIEQTLTRVVLPLDPTSPQGSKDGKDAAYKDITASPPPIDHTMMQRHEQKAREIYTELTKLTKPTTTAIRLTGFSDSDTSMLGAVVYHEAKKRRLVGDSPFNAEELWLQIDPGVTTLDIIGTIFDEYQNKTFSGLAEKSLAKRAEALLDVLDTPGKSRLIVLDRCEHWLNKVNETDSGVQECLNALNRQPCRSKVLLISHPLQQRNDRYPAVHMQEYPKPTILFELKKGTSITDSLIAEKITKDLNGTQRIVLSAFAVYRKAVPLAAAEIQLTAVPARKDIHLALDVLIEGQLLEPAERDQPGSRNRYSMQPGIAEGVQHYFMGYSNEHRRQQALRVAHIKAARYYEQEAKEARKHGDVDSPQRREDLVEAVWHLCQVREWEAAFNLAKREGLFSRPRNKQEAEMLREVYTLFLPLEKWHPARERVADIYAYQRMVYEVLEEEQ